MKRVLGAAVVAVLGLVWLAPASQAHVTKKVDGLDVELGWKSEPPVAGELNAITVSVHNGGAAVSGATLKVAATVGGKTSAPFALEPAGAGEYETSFIPTALGGFTFHLTGSAAGKSIDATYTPKDGVEEVKGSSVYAFPKFAPTTSQLADSLAALQKSQKAGRSRQRQIGIAALVGVALGAIALVTSRRKPSTNTSA